MPYAYQCCVYGSCDSYKSVNQWDTEQSSTDEDLHKRTVAMYPIHTDTNCKELPSFNVQYTIQYYTIPHMVHSQGKAGNLRPICLHSCQIIDIKRF